MGEIDCINKIQIELQGHCTETKLIDAVDRLAVVIDTWCDTNEECTRICSYAINRFADLKNSFINYTVKNGDR